MTKKTKQVVMGLACSLIEHVIEQNGLDEFGKGFISRSRDLNVSWQASEVKKEDSAVLVKVKEQSGWILLEVGWGVTGDIGNTMLVDMFVKDLAKVFEEHSDAYRNLKLY